MNLTVKPKVSGKASSSYTREQVEARLAESRARGGADAEIAYLEKVKARKGWTDRHEPRPG